MSSCVGNRGQGEGERLQVERLRDLQHPRKGGPEIVLVCEKGAGLRESQRAESIGLHD